MWIPESVLNVWIFSDKYFNGSEIFGFDSLKKYNLHILDNEHIIFCAGISYQIWNIKTWEKRVFFSKDLEGIGSIVVGF